MKTSAPTDVRTVDANMFARPTLLQRLGLSAFDVVECASVFESKVLLKTGVVAFTYHKLFNAMGLPLDPPRAEALARDVVRGSETFVENLCEIGRTVVLGYLPVTTGIRQASEVYREYNQKSMLLGMQVISDHAMTKEQ